MWAGFIDVLQGRVATLQMDAAEAQGTEIREIKDSSSPETLYLCLATPFGDRGKTLRENHFRIGRIEVFMLHEVTGSLTSCFFSHLSHCRDSEIIFLEINDDLLLGSLDVFGIFTWLNRTLEEKH